LTGWWFSPGTLFSCTNTNINKYNENIVESGIKHQKPQTISHVENT